MKKQVLLFLLFVLGIQSLLAKNLNQQIGVTLLSYYGSNSFESVTISINNYAENSIELNSVWAYSSSTGEIFYMSDTPLKQVVNPGWTQGVSHVITASGRDYNFLKMGGWIVVINYVDLSDYTSHQKKALKPADSFGTNWGLDDVSEEVVAEDFEGEGTDTSPFIIKSADNLKTLANRVNSGNSYTNTYFELCDNIDMTGEAFEPIGNQEHPFSGVFDGNGYKIVGLSVQASSYVGLFGYIDGATIKNVGIEDGNYQGLNLGGTYLGGIAGYTKNSIITNCYTRGQTNGNDCVGALVGYSGDGTVIQNCFSSMQHTKYQIYGSVGGLVGYNCGKLENSYFYGTINAKIFEKNTTGGIVGYNHTTGSIHYCYFIKYSDVMNGEFNYCGSLNWGDCYGTDSFDLNGVTTSGNYLHAKLNTWVDDHRNERRYRKWTSEVFPSFSEYADPIEQNEDKEFVDLGLPSGLLWATTNVGAKHPEEYGFYFAWAETTPKSEYSWATYKYANGSETSLTKYCSSSAYGNVDYKETLDEYDDAATVNWGKPWRAPTLHETQELYNYCTWTYSTKNGVSGYIVTGPNGNTIFLPAGGVMQHNMTFFSGTDACVQSATTFNASNGSPSSASVLYCEEGTPHYWYGWSRCWGYNVRPVTYQDPSSITVPSSKEDMTIIGIYDLYGHKLDQYQKGVNIVRFKNGSTKKIMK